MKKIKKFLALGLALSLTFALTACGSKGSSDAGSDSSDAKTEESASNGSFRTLDEIKESGTINVGVFSDKTASTRAMTCILQDVWQRIWA